MQKSGQMQVVLTTGLALFAMFFGAGNMIFPLKVGILSGDHTALALLAFIISGVGVPFLGVFAVSMYDGNYWKFFSRVGKPLAFIIITFLILFIGPLFAGPRTEVITFNTLLPLLPSVLKSPIVFSCLYFTIALALVLKQTRIVDIIGWFFSPAKIITFSILILVSLASAEPTLPSAFTSTQIFNNSFFTGYGTMDLLGAFFFCSVAYKNILNKSKMLNITSQQTIIKMMLTACIIGAGLISIIYTGFIFAAASHAQALASTPTEALIGKIADVTLGKYGMLFVGICVSVACLATGVTLIEVTTDYIYRTVLREKLPRVVCLLLTVTTMIMMSILGFDGIMKIAGPILNVLYPALIGLCLVNIFWKLYAWKKTSLVPQAIAAVAD